MGDAGEGLIDADSRILERIEEQQQNRAKAKTVRPTLLSRRSQPSRRMTMPLWSRASNGLVHRPQICALRTRP